MLDASNERPSMRPDVFVRRGGRAFATCFAAGEVDGAGATGVAFAVVTGADDGVAGAGVGVGAGLGGSDLATAFSPELVGAGFTGGTGLDGALDFGGVVVGASDFGGVLALGGAAGGEDGCDATAVGATDCGVTGCG